MIINSHRVVFQCARRLLRCSNNFSVRPATYCSNSINTKARNSKSSHLLNAVSWLDDVNVNENGVLRIRQSVGLRFSAPAYCGFHYDIRARLFSDGPSQTITGPLDDVTYETVAEETLQSLAEYFDEAIISESAPKDADVSYSGGVLTVVLGNSKGIYVINKQTPNKQIWLSSPKSGPKRYDFMNGRWIYKHDGIAMHDLLTKEMTEFYHTFLDFTRCSYG